MKHMKKLFAMLMAVIMLVGLLSVTSFADDPATYTITAPTNGTRSYEVYQIMTGDLTVKDGKDILSNVQWGTNAVSGKSGAVSKADMDAITAISERTTEADKAAAIAAYVNFGSTPAAVVSKDHSATVAAGYYLIKDIGEVGKGEAYSLYVVQVVGNTTIDPKVDTTSSQKKVKDINDSTDTAMGNWQDSADHNVGDAVPFQLKAIICDDYANYNYGYKLTFHDKESAGLTFNADSVKVYVDGKLLSSGYTVTTSTTDGDTFDVSFANLKTVVAADDTKVQAGSVITVEYTATLNGQAVMGSAGNPNEMYMTYTNNPNDDQAGENGETPVDKVIVFTYKVVANKYANAVSETTKLTGAGFTLYKFVAAADGNETYKDVKGNWTAVGDEVKGTDMTTFVWERIDDGEYKLVESTTPAGYNTIDPIMFTVSAEHDATADDPKLTSLTGGTLFTGKVSTGALTGDVVNQSGSTLPETGGMGTYIFYAVGGVLVLAAVVLFVTKKRMSNED